MGRPTAPCYCKLQIPKSCSPQAQHNLTKINLPEYGNSDHVFHKLHKNTHALMSNNGIISMAFDGIIVSKLSLITHNSQSSPPPSPAFDNRTSHGLQIYMICGLQVGSIHTNTSFALATEYYQRS
jgi:hypothetical protein